MSAEVAVADVAPCTAACPAGVNVQGYLGLIAQGRFPEALEVVRAALPFPGVCGRVCPAPCEGACKRAPHGGAVAVRALKRFISDVGRDAGGWGWSVPAVRFAEKIAVVGSGPAGLTAALELRRRGYAVTVFEARDELGGALTAFLPEFRLPHAVVRDEIEAIACVKGIEAKTGVRIGVDVSLAELFEQGHRAIVVAIGAHRGLELGIPGDDAENVVGALAFLSRSAPARMRGRVVVVGGGSTAMDAARTAIRRGCEEVRVLYRRSRAEMPAAREEVEQALQEGVILETLTAPVRVLVRDGHVSGLRCERTRLGEPDESGRRRPVVVADSAFVVPTDAIVAAIGQRPDCGPLARVSALVGEDGLIDVIPDTLETQEQAIFAAGDAVTGPATIIGAVGQARRVAATVHRVLRTGSGSAPERDQTVANGLGQLASSVREHRPRIVLPQLDGEDRRDGFEEVELAISAEVAMAEASRCLRCGSCAACTLCSSACRWRAAAFEADPPDLPDRLIRADRALLADSAGARAQLGAADQSAGVQAVVSLACTVDAALCRGCGECVEVCAFDAVQLDVSNAGQAAGVARIDPARCRGCGICVGQCPTGAVDAGVMSDTVLHRRLRAIAPGASIAIRCQWSKAAPDGDAVELQVPCAGRVSAGLVAWTLAHGAERVTVASCGESGCKYGRGAKLVSERLQWLLGSQPARVRLCEGDPRCLS